MSGSGPFLIAHIEQSRTHASEEIHESAIIALAGGSIDIQEQGLYKKLGQVVQKIQGSDHKTLGLIRHVSEWKILCEELSARFKLVKNPHISIISDESSSRPQIQNFIACFKKERSPAAIQIINAAYLRK